MKVAMGIVIGLLAPALIGICVLALGLVDVSAAASPGLLERTLAPWALNRSVARHAPQRSIATGGSEQVREGREHYKTNCLVCHAAPGVGQSELAKGLNPPAPSLDGVATQARSDGELYWIVSRGIRMTGMPAFGETHDDTELLNLVTFLRRLPYLTDDDRQFLNEGMGKEDHHHSDDSQGGAPSRGSKP